MSKINKVKGLTIIMLVIFITWIITIPLEALRVTNLFIACQSLDWCAFSSKWYWITGIMLITSINLMGNYYINLNQQYNEES